MLVYAESNFVLELAREQEQFQAALRLLELAETQQLTLILPTFALVEPFWTINKDDRDRQEVYKGLAYQSTQFRRANRFKALYEAAEETLGGMRSILEIEIASLEIMSSRLLIAARFIDLNKSIFEQTLYYQKLYDFKDVQDAVIFSSIIHDLKQQSDQETKCFVSRDIQAFGRKSGQEAQIKAELATYNCQIKFSFDDTLNFVQSQPTQP